MNSYFLIIFALHFSGNAFSEKNEVDDGTNVADPLQHHCDKGYQLGEDNQTCVDEDECQTYGSCSQYCENEDGGFKCSCAEGYEIDPLNTTRCKAKDQDISLFLTTIGVWKISLKNLETTIISRGDRNADFHFKTGMLYHGNIAKSPLDKSNKPKEVITMSGYARFAVDWIYNHIYFYNNTKFPPNEPTLKVIDFEGKMVKTLFTHNVRADGRMVLDPAEGWIFWINSGILERAGMDGSHREAFISAPNITRNVGAIALDLVLKRFYWADNDYYWKEDWSPVIACSNYDGSNILIVMSPSSYPENVVKIDSMTIFEDWIYISDSTQAVWKADKFTGKADVTPISKGGRLTRPNYLTTDSVVLVYHPEAQPKSENHCKDAKCSHLCLPAPRFNEESPKITCACPEGLQLGSDNVTCVDENGKPVVEPTDEDVDECKTFGTCSQICEDKKKGFKCSCFEGYIPDVVNPNRCKAPERNVSILYTRDGNIVRIGIDPKDETPTTLVNGFADVSGFDFDVKTGDIFWADGNYWNLHKTPVNDIKNPTTVLEGNENLFEVRDIAVDWIHNNIYFIENNRTIKVIDSDGKMVKTLFEGVNTRSPAAFYLLALDPAEGWMFYSYFSPIMRAAMDGSNRSEVMPYRNTLETLTLDLVLKAIYWTDRTYDLYSCNYDGTGERVVMRHDHFTYFHSIGVFEDSIYWIDHFSSKGFYKADKFTGENITQVMTLEQMGGGLGTNLLRMYHPYKQPESENYCKSANCSHLCLAAPRTNQEHHPKISCACPDGLRLKDNNTCVADDNSKNEDKSDRENSVPVTMNINGIAAAGILEEKAAAEILENKGHQETFVTVSMNINGTTYQGVLYDETVKYCTHVDEKEKKKKKKKNKKQKEEKTTDDRPCHCRKGYKFGENNKTCEDINECEIFGTCSQTCENVKGGFNCGCLKGFIADPQNPTRCKVEDPNVFLLFSTENKIAQFSLDTQKTSDVVLVNNTKDTPFDYDFGTGTLFWADETQNKIFKTSMREPEKNIFVFQNLTVGSVKSLAIDWIYGNIYWSDENAKTIYVADSEGKMQKPIIRDCTARSLVLDPSKGYFYFINEYSIKRSYMEGDGYCGDEIVPFIPFGLPPEYSGRPTNLVLDIVLKKLYWLDVGSEQIASCNDDGSNRKIVASSTGCPLFIDLFDDTLYWSDFGKQRGIHSADKFTGKTNSPVIMNVEDYPRMIKVYHHHKQPQGKNYCRNANCSHLCLASRYYHHYKCACPDGLHLEKTPYNIEPTKCIAPDEDRPSGN